MHISLRPLAALSLLVCLAGAQTPARITPAQAKDYIGKQATVCGKVASANYATRSKKQPTFLNLDEPYPRHIFTAVIWGDDRGKFGQPEVDLKDKKICVSGQIEEYRGKPEIILRTPSQLKVDDKRD